MNPKVVMKSEAQKRWEEKNALSGFDFFVLVEKKKWNERYSEVK